MIYNFDFYLKNHVWSMEYTSIQGANQFLSGMTIISISFKPEPLNIFFKK